MFPLFFDNEGLMWTDTYFGDYPRYGPAEPGKAGEFTGWMLLSYNKPVTASSAVGDHSPENMTDEQVKTYWLAEKNDTTEWVMIDKSNSFKDSPNDYVELALPVRTRYLRYRNVEVPTPHLAISDIRVFGIGEGKKPKAVTGFTVKRDSDRRDALITWDAQKNAQGYNVRWGIAPDKLYSSWLVYDDNQLLLKALTTDQEYYFTVEAFNENGISEHPNPIHIK